MLCTLVISTVVPLQAWERAARLMESLGHTIVPVSLPSTRHALETYYILAPVEAARCGVHHVAPALRALTSDVDAWLQQSGTLHRHDLWRGA